MLARGDGVAAGSGSGRVHALAQDGRVAGGGGGGTTGAAGRVAVVVWADGGGWPQCIVVVVIVIVVVVVVVARWRLGRGSTVPVDVDGEADVGTLEVHARALDANLLEGDHEHADELVAALEAQPLVLPVRFVEEYDVQRDAEIVGDLAHFSEDVWLELAAFAADEFDEALAKAIDLFEGCAVFDDDGDGFS